MAGAGCEGLPWARLAAGAVPEPAGQLPRGQGDPAACVSGDVAMPHVGAHVGGVRPVSPGHLVVLLGPQILATSPALAQR